MEGACKLLDIYCYAQQQHQKYTLNSKTCILDLNLSVQNQARNNKTVAIILLQHLWHYIPQLLFCLDKLDSVSVLNVIKLFTVSGYCLNV